MADRSNVEEHKVSEDLLNHAVNASMIDYIDSKVVVALRDDRHIVGYFRTFDQFNNIVITEASERFIHKGKYADKPLGSTMVRGESIAYVAVLNERHYRLQLVSTADLFAAMDADGATRTVALDAFAGAAGL